MEFSPVLQQKILPKHPIPNKDLVVNNTMSTDNNAVDDSSSSTNTESTKTIPKPLRPLGSGASDVIDPPEPGGETESKKLSSSKYKGVVPQPNGRWGAQIYEKHNRVWLGTFGEEPEAAKAYDVAAQRFRGTDAVTNFGHLSNTDEAELEFLRCHSKAEIVDMLRKHTYNDELRQSRNFPGLQPGFQRDFVGLEREHLFDKAVTPSDVGKLNRLVIPKHHAEKQFPVEFEKKETSKGVLLNFEDRTGKVWRFRYSYWNSSQSYVLTKGWSRFVKEKNLKAGDVVSFSRSVGADRKLWIEWTPRMGGDHCRTCRAIQLPVALAPVIRLFGVDIAVGGVAADASGKRRREVEVWNSQSYTRKRLVVGNISVGNY